MPPSKLAAILARAAARTEIPAPTLKLISAQATQEITRITNQSGNEISLNAEQQAFIDLVLEGHSCVLIGAAGTGKTTTMKGVIQALLQSSRYIGTIESEHKYLPRNSPGIVATSYTRRSVTNLRKAMPEDLKNNCITLNKLLEYQPEYFSVLDPVTGEEKNTMRFVPGRNENYPLPEGIQLIIIDEASTVSVELYKILCYAISHKIQFIYLGDLNQLPPVFGSAILGFKGIEHIAHTVELKQVYRQALESPIIRLAHRILSGKPIPVEEYPDWHFKGELTIHPWKKRISADNALATIAAFFKRAYDANEYNPEDDMILIPFNKACGTDELNKYIANHIARRSQQLTYEIQAGWEKVYFSVGDIVMYDKSDAVITNITPNPNYIGRTPTMATTTLDYWGHDPNNSVKRSALDDVRSAEEIELLLESSMSEIEEKTNQASHIVTIRFKETMQDLEINTAAGVKALSLGYSMTIHKSQGSQWNKVFCVFHQSHGTMMQRELLYTAVTRAAKELYIICEQDTFTKAIINQRIKGETLEEKFDHFKGKLLSNTNYGDIP